MGAQSSLQLPRAKVVDYHWPPFVSSKALVEQSRLLLSFGWLWAGVCSAGPLSAFIEPIMSGGGDFREARTGYGSLCVLQGNWYGQTPVWETRWHSSFWLCEPSSSGEQDGVGWEKQQHSWGW